MSLLRIAWGDLRRIGKDRRAVLWALVMPLVLAFVFGNLFHYGPSPTTSIPVVGKGHRCLRLPPMAFDLSLPGFLVMFAVLAVIAGGGTVLIQDRLQGQLARLATAPMSTFEIYAGKTPARILHGLQRVMYFNKSYEVLLLECPILLGFAAAVLMAAAPFLKRCRDKPGAG